MALVEQVAKRRGPLVRVGRTGYVREALCAWSDLAASLPTRGDPMPAGYIEGADGDAAAILQETLIGRGAQGAVVTLVYERIHAGSGLSLPSGWTLLEIDKGVVVDARGGKAVTCKIEVPSTTTEAEVESVVAMESTWPGEGGVWAPKLRRFVLTSAFRQGKSLVTLLYEPATTEDILLDNPSYVSVEATGIETMEKPVVDLTPKYVWYEQRDAGGGASHRWQPVKGKGLQPRRRMIFRTRLVKPYGMGGNLLSYQDSVNGFTAGQYWNCPSGTMRFAGWTKRRARTTEKLWIYDTLIEYLPQGWNKETMVQRFEYRVFQIPVRSSAGALVEDHPPRTIGDWFPDGDPYYAKFMESKQWPLLLGTYDW